MTTFWLIVIILLIGALFGRFFLGLLLLVLLLALFLPIIAMVIIICLLCLPFMYFLDNRGWKATVASTKNNKTRIWINGKEINTEE